MKRLLLLCSSVILFAASFSCAPATETPATHEPYAEGKPYTRWWWFAADISKEDVRYQLESVTSQLRVLSNQVDYATIDLSIEQVQEYTPVFVTLKPAAVPAMPSSMRRSMVLILYTFFGGVLAVAYVLLKEPFINVYRKLFKSKR